MNEANRFSRRNLLHAGALAALAVPLSALPARGDAAGDELLQPATKPFAGTPNADPWHGLKFGVASYSFRKIPVDVTIAGIRRLDLHYVSIKDAHLKLDSTTEERNLLGQRFREAGITPLSCGVISIKNDERVARNAFEYARDIGVSVIVSHPVPEVLPLLDKLVAEFNIKVAIHNHGPEAPYFKSPYDSWKAIQGHDERIGLCIDVGHTARANVDPVQAINTCKSRLYDVHMKDDINRNTAKGGMMEVELGRGTLDVRGMLAALIQAKFAGHVGLEHEKNAESPLPGLAESTGYAKGILTSVPERIEG